MQTFSYKFFVECWHHHNSLWNQLFSPLLGHFTASITIVLARSKMSWTRLCICILLAVATVRTQTTSKQLNFRLLLLTKKFIPLLLTYNSACSRTDALDCPEGSYCDQFSACDSCVECFRFQDAIGGVICPSKCKNSTLECQARDPLLV
jgi:hypothetical protein